MCPSYYERMQLASSDQLLIREMEDSDKEYALLLKWLANPSVNEWYENRAGLTLDAIRTKYRPRVVGESHVRAAIIERQHKPIGYLQYYETQKEKYRLKEPVLEEPNVWAMDIFIGEPSLFGKGLGSASLELMLRFLFDQKGAKKVIIDPDVRNERAIRAYEKAGFRKLKRLKHWETHLGEPTDAWLMVCEKPNNGNP